MAIIPDPRIWVCDSMAYHLRKEFVSPETIDAQAEYRDAKKKCIAWKAKYYGDLYTRLHREDVKRAISHISKQVL